MGSPSPLLARCGPSTPVETRSAAADRRPTRHSTRRRNPEIRVCSRWTVDRESAAACPGASGARDRTAGPRDCGASPWWTTTIRRRTRRRRCSPRCGCVPDRQSRSPRWCPAIVRRPAPETAADGHPGETTARCGRFPSLRRPVSSPVSACRPCRAPAVVHFWKQRRSRHGRSRYRPTHRRARYKADAGRSHRARRDRARPPCRSPATGRRAPRREPPRDPCRPAAAPPRHQGAEQRSATRRPRPWRRRRAVGCPATQQTRHQQGGRRQRAEVR